MDNLIVKRFPYIKPGDRYHKLTVIETFVVYGTYRYVAACMCDCGTEIITRIDGLRSSKNPTQSCGCAQKQAVTKHGEHANPLFKIWSGMMDRCYNKANKRYSSYGGRGIYVHEHWHNLKRFLSDMNPTYTKGLQLDRVDNDGPYSHENCRWATRVQQARNKRTNVVITFNGSTRCLSEWSEVTGIHIGTLWDRLNVRGWSIEQTLTTPPMSSDESTKLARTTRYGKT